MNRLAKLYDNREKMKELIWVYEDNFRIDGWTLNPQTNENVCVGCEKAKKIKKLFVDLAAHYFARFGVSISTPST